MTQIAVVLSSFRYFLARKELGNTVQGIFLCFLLNKVCVFIFLEMTLKSDRNISVRVIQNPDYNYCFALSAFFSPF